MPIALARIFGKITKHKYFHFLKMDSIRLIIISLTCLQFLYALPTSLCTEEKMETYLTRYESKGAKPYDNYIEYEICTLFED